MQKQIWAATFLYPHGEWSSLSWNCVWGPFYEFASGVFKAQRDVGVNRPISTDHNPWHQSWHHFIQWLLTETSALSLPPVYGPNMEKCFALQEMERAREENEKIERVLLTKVTLCF